MLLLRFAVHIQLRVVPIAKDPRHVNLNPQLKLRDARIFDTPGNWRISVGIT